MPQSRKHNCKFRLVSARLSRQSFSRFNTVRARIYPRHAVSATSRHVIKIHMVKAAARAYRSVNGGVN